MLFKKQNKMRIIVETAFLADCLNTFALLKQLFVSLDVNNIKDESFFAGKFSESARRELSEFFELG